jgi:hypothetical protein
VLLTAKGRKQANNIVPGGWTKKTFKLVWGLDHLHSHISAEARSKQPTPIHRRKPWQLVNDKATFARPRELAERFG